jgi:hypothetical protein
VDGEALVAAISPGTRAAEVVRRAGGNPLFLEQVARLGVDAPVPPGVRAVIEQRLATLSRGCLALLERAAVLKPEPGAALDEAVAAGLLVADPPGYRFGHDLVRETVEARLDPGTRKELALALEERADVAPALLAHHFRLAGDTERALRYSVAAAREAGGRSAYEDAVRHWARAVEVAGPDPALSVELADARRRAGQGGAAREEYARAVPLADEAVAVARAADDPAALATCLVAAHHVRWAPGTAARRLELAESIVDTAHRYRDPELLVEGRLLRATDLLELADPRYATELTEFLRLADESGQPRLRYHALSRRALRALLGGRFADADRYIEEAATLGRAIGEPEVEQVRISQRWVLLLSQGRIAELEPEIVALYPDGEAVQLRGYRLMRALHTGDRDAAARIAATMPPPGTPDGLRAPDRLAGLVQAAAALAALGRPDECRIHYAALAPYAGQTAFLGVAVAFLGAVDHYLGLLAVALGEDGKARAHLTRALDIHERLGALPWALWTRAALAAADDTAALREVEAQAAALGLALPRTTTAEGVFRREGPQWTVSYRGHTVTVKHSKGMADLAALLARPGQPVPAADLVAADAGPAARADLWSGADPVLDARAKAQLRRRLTDLAEEIDEAERWYDPERLHRARAERDALLAELSAATGLGGRDRRLGDAGERARKAVTARIRDAVATLASAHPALGEHLRASLTTGTSCSYRPAPPVVWRG